MPLDRHNTAESVYIKVQITDLAAKVRIVRHGPNRLYGEYSERQNFTEDKLVGLFDRVWYDGLEEALRLDSLECSKDVAKMRLPKIPLTFFATSYVLRQLRYEGIDFIARLKDLGSNTYELDQLWKVSAGDDQPKTLYVIFKSAEERKEFRSLASSLGWKDDELGLCLIDDFIKKHDRVKARLQSHQAPSEDNDNS